MRTIVAGSRDFRDYGRLVAALDMHYISVILSGAARGADRLGERYAAERGIPIERYPAQWELYGRRAGYLRNEEMASAAESLVAFWDGMSPGTGHMIDIARRYGLRVWIVPSCGWCGRRWGG